MKPIALFVVCLSTLAACVAGSGEDPTPTPAPENWSEMNRQQRIDFMEDVVLPAMRRRFQAFNATEFADFDCETCHGVDMEANDYAMPEPSLERLDPSNLPSRTAAGGEGRWARFMEDQVSAVMAELLEVPAYDPNTGEGFWCFECHTER